MTPMCTSKYLAYYLKDTQNANLSNLQRPWKRYLANANAVRRLLINARIVATPHTITYLNKSPMR